jgi:hypothetical protein
VWQVLADMAHFVTALDRVLTELKTFYLQNKLDDPQ